MNRIINSLIPFFQRAAVVLAIVVFIAVALVCEARAQVPLMPVSVSDQAMYDRIVASSTTAKEMECSHFVGALLVSSPNADCSFGGSVNSGSGIGVAVSFHYANKLVDRVTIARAGITFIYPGGTMVHSDVSGACFSAVYTATVYFVDGEVCTITSTGNPPHSACTETAINNSSAIVSAASFSEQTAPGAIVAAFGNNYTSQTASATTLPLPQTLGGVEAYVFLNTPLARKIGIFYASPMQANVLLPDDLAFGGLATMQIVNVGEDSLRPGFFSSNEVEPSIFTQGSDGHGAAAGYMVGNYLVIFGTGFNKSRAGFLVSGLQRFPAEYVGPTGDAPPLAGLTQINVVTTLPHGAQVSFCAETTPGNARCSQVFYLP